MMMMPQHPAAPRAESPHNRLYEFSKSALTKIFVHPYASVCELYCGSGGVDPEKWDEFQIGHYIGIDVSTSGISQKREAWESQRKGYTADFFELDPCMDDIGPHLNEDTVLADLVCCLQNLQLCFQTEEKARRLLLNVSALLKPGGYFFGITPDSSTIWAKYQKNVEAYHNRSAGMKPNIVPNCIRSENYVITFEIEEEKFPLFGKKYLLKLANDLPPETHCLVHFPSFIRLAREAGIECVEIQNLTEFYDDNRAHFAGMLMNLGPNLADPRGRLLPRSYDVLGLYTTFIFQKPDPEIAPPVMTPVQDPPFVIDEKEWHGSFWRDEEKSTAEPPLPGLGKISEQKGILGPGPAELRFAEPLDLVVVSGKKN
ncbi:mRNA cap guanine-N7 methyltransferase 2 [Argentina anserina]|uniref:mRNA cap guanine-N7 methyltransferase 2 n=1 Tax=Argentina anserina TaxID=57926 RepID=UPI00217641A4|nr:mRNA cap guanine-N7 methyltransferase 2 [Potentilla anserina]